MGRLLRKIILPFINFAFFAAMGSTDAYAVDGMAVTILAKSLKSAGSRGDLIRYDIRDSKVIKRSALYRGDAQLPLLSPDGKFVVFIKSDSNLAIISTKGGYEKVLAKLPPGVKYLEWPTGKWIYYSNHECSSSKSLRINRIHTETRTKQEIILSDSNDLRSSEFSWFRAHANKKGRLDYVNPSAIKTNQSKVSGCYSFLDAISPTGRYGISVSSRNGKDFLIWNAQNFEDVARLECKDINICNPQCCYISKIRWSVNSDEWVSLTQRYSESEGANCVLHNWTTHEKIALSKYSNKTGLSEADGDFWLQIGPSIQATPKEVEFILPPIRAAGSYTKTISITNGGDGELPYLVATAAPKSPSWLSGTITGKGNIRTLSIRVANSSLSSGTYNQEIIIRGSNVKPISIRVKVVVPDAELSNRPEFEVLSCGVNEVQLKLNRGKILSSSAISVSSGIEVKSTSVTNEQRQLAITTSTLNAGQTYTLTCTSISYYNGSRDTVLPVSVDFTYRDTSSMLPRLISFYDFKQIAFNTIKDPLNPGEMDLAISHAKNPLVEQGSLQITSPGRIVSQKTPKPILSACTKSNAFSLEILLHATNISNPNPAYVVALGSRQDIITLSQEKSDYVLRFKATISEIKKDTMYEIRLPGVVGKNAIHLIFSKDTTGKVNAFINGNVASAIQTQGNLYWLGESKLYIGNDYYERKPWIGNIYGIYFYDRAISAAEARERFTHYKPSVLKPTPSRVINSSENALHLHVRYDFNSDLLVNVPINTPYSLELVGVDGKVIQVYRGSSAKEYTFSRSSIASGIYMVRVQYGKRLISRMVVMR